ncbi:SpoIIE family protein phosphatase [Mycobacterium triplex]|uniref:SpoIIE family protein phosphatase n=1 Tax=Mycobacterium triplex TaxID=47839 RepID=UPI00111C4BC6|nr:SpoIIE family protein phosphatase [Mycobacterium triplex]
MLPGAFATVIAVRVDLGSGLVEAACAGHLIPYLTNPTALSAPVELSPPIGIRGVTYTPSERWTRAMSTTTSRSSRSGGPDPVARATADMPGGCPRARRTRPD